MLRDQWAGSFGELLVDEGVVLDYLAAQLGPRSDRPPRRARIAPTLLPPPSP